MQRASLAVSTWFRLPEYMERLEILSRGSAFRLASGGVVEACTEASSPVCHADRDAAVLTPIDAGALDALGMPALDLALDTLEDGAALTVDGYHRCE